MQDCYAVFQPGYARFTLVRQERQVEQAGCRMPVRPFSSVQAAPEVDSSPRSVAPGSVSSPVADVTTSTTPLANRVPPVGTRTPDGGARFSWHTTAMTACTDLFAPAPVYVRAASVALIKGAR